MPPFPRAAVNKLEPKALVRLFRSRPRNGVSGGDLLSALEASAELFNSGPAIPGAKMSDTAPNRVERLFKARPRAGIDDLRLPVFENWAPHATQPSPELRVIPVSTCALAGISAVPPMLTRAFRMRPRAGIADSSLSTYELLNVAASANEVSPLVAAMPAALAACSPQELDKLYRMRPRAGVADPAIVYHLAIDAAASTVILHPVITSLVFAGTTCAPSALDRLYRMRPRAGVADRNAATSTADPFAALSFVPLPALPGPLAGALETADEQVPVVVEKLFRMRPRAGINDPHARLQDIGSHGSITGTAPRPGAYPAAAFISAGASLPLAGRLFRMRPRAGINDPNAQLQDPDSHGAVAKAQTGPEAYPTAVFSAVTASLGLTDRLFRMRPRGGVDDPNAQLQDSGSHGAVPKAQTGPEAYPSTEFTAAASSLAPTDRLFRMRPRGGVRGSIAVALNRPEPVHDERIARAYPGMTGSSTSLVAQRLCALRRLDEVTGAAEWLAESAAPLAAARQPPSGRRFQPPDAPPMRPVTCSPDSSWTSSSRRWLRDSTVF